MNQLLAHHGKARISIASVAPPTDVAVRGGEANSGAATSGQQPKTIETLIPATPTPPPATTDGADAAPAAVPLKPPTLDVIATAVDDFNRAISLNPNSPDAYRDRAEALRLAKRMSEAEQSATTACELCNYRQARSLRTLAQICYDSGRYDTAADYAMRAAELTSGDEQQRFLHLWVAYGKHASGDTVKLAVASEHAGFIASRGGEDTNPKTPGDQKPPRLIEPPPGFMPRSGSASP